MEEEIYFPDVVTEEEQKRKKEQKKTSHLCRKHQKYLSFSRPSKSK